jgi:hypothetical protein
MARPGRRVVTFSGRLAALHNHLLSFSLSRSTYSLAEWVCSLWQNDRTSEREWNFMDYDLRFTVRFSYGYFIVKSIATLRCQKTTLLSSLHWSI